MAHNKALALIPPRDWKNERAALDRGEKVDVAGQALPKPRRCRACSGRNAEGDGYAYEPKVIGDEDSHMRYVPMKRKAESERLKAQADRELKDFACPAAAPRRMW